MTKQKEKIIVSWTQNNQSYFTYLSHCRVEMVINKVDVYGQIHNIVSGPSHVCFIV